MDRTIRFACAIASMAACLLAGCAATNGMQTQTSGGSTSKTPTSSGSANNSAGNYTFYASLPIQSSGDANTYSDFESTSQQAIVSSGDVAVQFCRASGLTLGAMQLSSYNSRFDPPQYVAQGIDAKSDSDGFQIAFYPSLTVGTQQFTCSSYNGTNGDFQGDYVSGVVLLYHHTGSAPTYVSAGSNAGICASASSCVSSAVTPAVPTLTIFCATETGGPYGDPLNAVFAAGEIGGVQAALRGTSAVSSTTASDSACQDADLSASKAGMTAAMSSNVAGTWGYVLASFQ